MQLLQKYLLDVISKASSYFIFVHIRARRWKFNQVALEFEL